ncbi:MAG: molybdenum cofactor guanylyltransferase [Thermodesulfovibrionales bacterium]|nr:molybdenum cofactor guanylyltransferase [Thermodesulfovibrionales bacterium]
MLTSKTQILSGVVLAGGENSRFPILKGFLKIDGITIIEKNIHILQTLCKDVLISTNKPELYFKFKVNMIADLYPASGPMAGIHSSLINAIYDNLLVIACDMPFLNSNLLAYLIKKHFEGNNLATIPSFRNKIQPLCGIYNKKIIPPLEKHLEDRKNSLYLFLKDIKINIINEKEIKNIDPFGHTFININTIDDFETIKKEKSNISMAI